LDAAGVVALGTATEAPGAAEAVASPSLAG
jgi:hypothetical protein